MTSLVFCLAAWFLAAIAAGNGALRRAVSRNYRFPLLRGMAASHSTWFVATWLERSYFTSHLDEVARGGVSAATMLGALGLWIWALYYRDRLLCSRLSDAQRPLRPGLHPLTLGVSCLLAFVATPPLIIEPIRNRARASAPPRLAPAADRAAVQLYETARRSVLALEIFDDAGRRVGQASGFLLDDAAVDEFGLRDYLADACHASQSSAEPSPPLRLAVTNAHVANRATTATAHYVGGSQGKVVELLAEDDIFDLALLVVEAPSGPRPAGLPLATHDPMVMQSLYAISSPRGFMDTICSGHVSGYASMLGQRWLQTSCPLGPGSSGGPVLSADGAVVGVAAKLHQEIQCLNLAAKVSTLRDFLERTNFAARRRALPAGGSLRWHEQRERDRLATAAAAHGTSAPTSPAAVALAQLHAAYEQLHDVATASNASFSYAALQHQAAQAARDVPDDFRYLAHYVAGRCAAAQAADDARQRRAAGGRRLAAAAPQPVLSHAAAATAHFEQALLAPRDPALPLASAVRHHLDCGHWNLAVALADQLVACLPRSGEALWLRAEGHLGAERGSEAIADMEAAVEFNPADAWFHYRLGQIYATTGRWSDAIASYELAMKLGSLSQFDPRAARLGVARAYEALGNDRRALAEWRELRRWGFPHLYCAAFIGACEHRLAQDR